MADLREEPVVSVAIQTEPRERWGIIQTMDGLVRGGRTVRIGNAACWCWAVIGDHECDPRNDWLPCLAATCPLVVTGPAPARLEELA
jgi:hypothetical protein